MIRVDKDKNTRKYIPPKNGEERGPEVILVGSSKVITKSLRLRGSFLRTERWGEKGLSRNQNPFRRVESPRNTICRKKRVSGNRDGRKRYTPYIEE